MGTPLGGVEFFIGDATLGEQSENDDGDRSAWARRLCE
jgi:hypothetical protein